MRKNGRRLSVVIGSLISLGMLLLSDLQFPAGAQNQPSTPTPTVMAGDGDPHDQVFPEPVAPSPQAAANCPLTRSSSQFSVPECNDVTFIVDRDTGLDTGCTFRASGPLTFNIVVNRYPGEIDKLLSAGLIPPYALLRMPAYDVDYVTSNTTIAPERDHISLNGKPIGELTGENNIWKLNTFSIDIKALNFAKFENGALVPGVNQIKIDIDTANSDQVWCTAIDWATLSVNLPPPVLFVHGILSKGETWDGPWAPAVASVDQGWRTSVTNLGIPNDAITMGGAPGSPFALDSIQSNAAKISAAIANMRTKYGVDKVNIVAHSKGGLDARHYIEDNDTVNTLIQIGTPNAGSPLADIVQLALIGATIFSGNPTIGRGLLQLDLSNPAGYQLTTPYMATYNLFHGRNTETRYVSLAGDYDAEGLANILEYLLIGPDDGVVQVSSVQALSYATKLIHQSAGTDATAAHTGETKANPIYEKLRPYVVSARRNKVELLAGTNSEITTNTAQQTNDMKPLQTLLDTVTQGQTKNFPIIVDAATTVGFLLYHTGGNLDLTLVAPDGSLITPESASQNSAITFSRSDTAGTNLEGYTIQNAAPGTYQLRVAGTTVADASGAQMFIAAAVSTGSAITLAASTDKAYYSLGQSVTVRAQVTASGSSLIGATADAQVLRPNNTSEVVTLFDDGLIAHGDQTANDGIYSNKITVALAGAYRIIVGATKASGPVFRREALLDVPVSASTSKVGTAYSASTRDTNRNSFFDELIVTVPLNITTNGTYRITGQLADKNGRIIDTATIKLSLTTGVRSANLVFDGSRIYRNAVDGPYTLALVQLSEEGETSTQPLAEITNAYTTRTYTFRQFERAAIAVGGTGHDKGIDSNGDGKFEQVQIDIDVDVQTAGTFQWTGLLTDHNGREIGFAKNTGPLVAGKNVLSFVFNSSLIVLNGVDGPYTLNSVLIFSNSASTVAFEVYETSPYTIDQFNKSTIALLPMIVTP